MRLPTYDEIKQRITGISLNAKMEAYAEGYKAAIDYLTALQSDCETQEDADTLEISIELLQGEYEMLPIVRQRNDL